MRLTEGLRAARQQRGLTQTALAAKLGKRQQFVSKYEAGERRLDIVEFLDVTRALDLTLEGFLAERLKRVSKR